MHATRGLSGHALTSTTVSTSTFILTSAKFSKTQCEWNGTINTRAYLIHAPKRRGTDWRGVYAMRKN